MSRGRQVAEARIFAFEIVIAVRFGNRAGRLAAIFLALGHPDAAVVAQRLGHQRQLGLVLAADGDAGRVNLRVAGIGEERALLVGAPGGGDVAALGVGGEEEDVAVAAGGQHHRVAGVRGDLAGDQVAHDDALGVAVDDHQVEHLRAREHLHRAEADLAAQRLVGAEQQLLAGLAARVEGARDLRAAEGAVGQQAAVFARERHALGHALVDDVHAHLREPIDVGLARAEVAALDRVVEQPVNAVAVVLVVLGGVDAALGGDAVRAARAVLEAEAFDLVAQLGQRGGGRGAGQAGADDDDVELPLVGRVDQLQVELVLVPLLRPAGRWVFWRRGSLQRLLSIAAEDRDRDGDVAEENQHRDDLLPRCPGTAR